MAFSLDHLQFLISTYLSILSLPREATSMDVPIYHLQFLIATYLSILSIPREATSMDVPIYQLSQVFVPAKAETSRSEDSLRSLEKVLYC